MLAQVGASITAIVGSVSERAEVLLLSSQSKYLARLRLTVCIMLAARRMSYMQLISTLLSCVGLTASMKFIK